jgi:hypothetical protein
MQRPGAVLLPGGAAHAPFPLSIEDPSSKSNHDNGLKSPDSGASTEETASGVALALLPKRTRVIVTGNNRTKRALIGQVCRALQHRCSVASTGLRHAWVVAMARQTANGCAPASHCPCNARRRLLLRRPLDWGAGISWCGQTRSIAHACPLPIPASNSISAALVA